MFTVHDLPGGRGGNIMYVCLYQKCVRNTKPKACTVGIYSTKESQCLYSLGEYIYLLLIVYLKISLIYM